MISNRNILCGVVAILCGFYSFFPNSATAQIHYEQALSLTSVLQGFESVPLEDASADFVLTPSVASAATCDEFTVLVSIETNHQLNLAEAHFTFPASDVQVVSITAPGGGSLPTAPLNHTSIGSGFDNVNGTLFYQADVLGSVGLPSTNFDFFEITFSVIGNSGTADIVPVVAPAFPSSKIAIPGFVDGVLISTNFLSAANTASVVLGPDATLPVVTCVEAQSVNADTGVCFYTVVGTEFDYVSATDNCGVTNVTNDFNGTASLAGAQIADGTTITWTAEDALGNEGSCSFVVAVVDTENPVAICQDITVQLDALGIASITASQIDNMSTDNCGVSFFSLNQTDFDCSNIGANTVILTAVDGEGNSSTCTATVTVEDNVNPTAICQDITVQLDAAGAATISASQIDNGSNDACGVSSVVVNQTDFSCADLGANTVVLTVTDVNGNVATCTATVTVEDNIAPEALCVGSFIVELGTDGTATIDPSDIDNGSFDACGVSLSLDRTDFDCSDISIPSASSLIITGVIDGPLSGGTPKAVELYVVEDIADLSIYGVGSANNGGGSDGEEFTLSGSAMAGEFIYVASESSGFTSFFGISPNFTNGAMAINGDDAVELFENGEVIDVFGDINTDGSGEAWDHLDGWAYRVSETGPDGSTFELSSWTFSGANELDGESANSSASSPFPLGTYSSVPAMDIMVTLTATDASGNQSSCTASITVVDNIAPVVVCNDITVQLDASGSVTISADDIDGGSSASCGVVSRTLDVTEFTCADIGDNDVTLTVTDINGNESSCTATVTVEYSIPLSVQCLNPTIVLDGTGNATINIEDIDGSSYNACGIASRSIDVTSVSCADVGTPVQVTLTVVDNNGGTAACVSTVTVVDNEAPIVSCVTELEVYLGEDGTLTLSAEEVDNGSTDVCGIASLSIDRTDFDCTDIGAASAGPEYALIISGVMDGSLSGGTPKVMELYVAQDIADLSIYGLGLSPNGSGSQGQSFALSGSASAGEYIYITASSAANVTGFNSFFGFNPNFSNNVVNFNGDDVVTLFENGSVLDVFGELGVDGSGEDWEYMDGWAYRNDLSEPNAGSFDASNWFYSGPNALDSESDNATAESPFPIENYSAGGGDLGTPITLTVTDNSGNVSTCTSNIIVLDSLAPIAVCQDITVQLDATGNATINVSDIDGGSTDNCGIESTSIDVTSFTCAEVGVNTVMLTVADIHGNESTCAASVTVEDSVVPTVICQDITVQLDANGVASITAADIHSSSDDACGIAAMTVDQSEFDCTHIGANTVTLTVTDNNGNASMCTATVTVEDNVDPIAICQNITVQLDAAGSVSITAAQIDNGSNDACGIAGLSIDVDSFDCTDIGDNTVQLTVTDNNGNTSSCTATVTIEDDSAPSITCAAGGERFAISASSYVVVGAEFDPTDVSDNCSASLVVTHNAEALFGDQSLSDNTLADWTIPVGIHTVTFSATDGFNTTTCDVEIEVVELSLSGNITMNLSCTPLPVQVKLYEAGTPNASPVLVATFTTVVDNNGDFTVDLPGIAPGTYGVYIQVDTYLQQFIGDNLINGAFTGISLTGLTPGDIAGATFGDNQVGGTDLSLLVAAYNTEVGDAAYNERADLDCNGQVDGLDMSVLTFFYNQMGDSPLQ